MTLSQLQTYTFVTKYARYSPELGRRETYEEATNRVFDMHKRRYANKGIDAEIEYARQACLDRLVLGSQRALQFGGKAIEKTPARQYNCTTSYCDRPKFFQEALWLLLCGAGVGFSVQRHHIAKLPMIAKPTGDEQVFKIPDSIEGWADGLGVLLSSYFVENAPFPEYAGRPVRLDYSLIRPAGSPISSCSGKAPGPEPLRRAMDKIQLLMEQVLAEAGSPTHLKPIQAYDVMMHASDAVLSGGVRRSATICIFSPDDEEMVNAKTGDWFIKNPQRGRSNNSALLLRAETSFDQFNALMKAVKEFGEPGFVWADSTEILYNPCCVPGSTSVMTSAGPKPAKDLVGVPFTAVVNGAEHESDGFFATGVKPVFEVTSKEGFKVRATGDHRFLVEQDGTQVWKTISELQAGQQIVLHTHDGYAWSGRGTFDEGWLLGYWVGNGTVDENQALLDFWGEHADELLELSIGKLQDAGLSTGHTRGGWFQDKTRVGSTKLFQLASDIGLAKKAITPEFEAVSSECYAGFLRGYFDADGCVQGTQAKGCSIRLTSVILANLEAVQRMLLRLGIYSKIYNERRAAGEYMLPDGKGGHASYTCQEVHELVIAKRSMAVFAQRVGFSKPDKAAKLAKLLASYKRRISADRFVATVADIKDVGTETVYDCTVPGPHAFDADGFYAHNCEIGLYPVDEVTGETGFAFCNLCEINAKLCVTVDDFRRACTAAAILGTLQAGYTEFAYLGPVSERIARREALLGVSMTGMMDNPFIAFDPALQKVMARHIVDVNGVIAKAIGINPTARATCVKPAGSTSCILGTASGIHPHHAKRYFRRVQANQMETPFQYFKAHNPRAVEASVWSPNKDAVITFCVEVPKEAQTMNEVSALDLLEKVKLTQTHWVDGGRVAERCAQPWLRHNVSNTVTVRDHEWDDVARYIYDNREAFAGISLLPMGGDLDYPQAPFCAVWTYEEIVKEYGVGALFASGLIVDGLHAFNEDLWAACACVLGTGQKLDLPTPAADMTNDQWLQFRREVKAMVEKKDWVRRANKFAQNYFAGDVKRMTHCLKRVSLCKLWEDLAREYVPVDYTLMFEDSDQTTLRDTVACAGGKCEIQ